MPAVNQIEVCGLVTSALCIMERQHGAVQLHPLCQQQPIVSYCQQHSIAVQAYCPILRGKMDHPVIQEISAKVHSNLLQMFSLLILSPAWGPAIYPQLDRDPAQILLRWSLQKGCAYPRPLQLR
jgi:diketogulonate reductase-like aldo/keto reductase